MLVAPTQQNNKETGRCLSCFAMYTKSQHNLLYAEQDEKTAQDTTDDAAQDTDKSHDHVQRG